MRWLWRDCLHFSVPHFSVSTVRMAHELTEKCGTEKWARQNSDVSKFRHSTGTSCPKNNAIGVNNLVSARLIIRMTSWHPTERTTIMPVPSMACRRELIGLFLNDSLSDVEQAAFEEHLATCADCREELSASAAEPELWSEAAEALSDDAIECGVSAPLWIEPTDEDDDAERNPARRQNSERAGTPHAKVQVPAVQAVLNLLAPTDDPHKLGRLSGYEIAGVIGCGGMGVVLKGFDASLNRFVAIKVLAAHLASSGAARRRFARQAQAAAAVVHDNVVAIHGVAEANEMPYLVMPYIRRIDVDVDSNKQLVATYRVTAIPTFIRCFEGNEVERGGTRWNESKGWPPKTECGISSRPVTIDRFRNPKRRQLRWSRLTDQIPRARFVC